MLVIKAPSAVSIAEGSEMVLTLPQDETKQVRGPVEITVTGSREAPLSLGKEVSES